VRRRSRARAPTRKARSWRPSRSPRRRPCASRLLRVDYAGHAVPESKRSRAHFMADPPKDPFLAGVPERIHLERVEHVPAGHADPALEVLRPLGFTGSARYRVREMSGVVLEALVHEGERVYAVLSRHPRAGSWLTLGCRYAGEGGLRRIGYTNATSPLIGVLEVPRDAIHVKAPGLPAEKLFARLIAERPAGELEPVSQDSFAAVYERAYAEEMDWRVRKGVSLGEVGRVAEARRENKTEAA